MFHLTVLIADMLGTADFLLNKPLYLNIALFLVQILYILSYTTVLCKK